MSKAKGAITCYIAYDLRDKLNMLAKARGKNMTEMIEFLIEQETGHLPTEVSK